jgi:hypothetical protein
MQIPIVLFVPLESTEFQNEAAFMTNIVLFILAKMVSLKSLLQNILFGTYVNLVIQKF